MRVARLLAKTLLAVGFGRHQRVRRRGVVYDLDLLEAIDLTIFLSGTFQRHVTRTIARLAPEDAVIVDVGANIGAVTLAVAAALARARVLAVEPTDYAIAKLRKNVELNPALGARIEVIQTLLAASTRPTSELVAYSSWSLAGSGGARHEIHEGVPMAVAGGQTTLDELVTSRGLDRVDVVKIDTDGHEFEVLSGAREVMERFRPAIVFEACEYLMRPPHPVFEDFETLFGERGYVIRGKHGGRLTGEQFRRACPRGSGLDLLAQASAE